MRVGDAFLISDCFGVVLSVHDDWCFVRTQSGVHLQLKRIAVEQGKRDVATHQVWP